MQRPLGYTTVCYAKDYCAARLFAVQRTTALQGGLLCDIAVDFVQRPWTKEGEGNGERVGGGTGTAISIETGKKMADSLPRRLIYLPTVYGRCNPHIIDLSKRLCGTEISQQISVLCRKTI